MKNRSNVYQLPVIEKKRCDHRHVMRFSKPPPCWCSRCGTLGTFQPLNRTECKHHQADVRDPNLLGEVLRWCELCGAVHVSMGWTLPTRDGSE